MCRAARGAMANQSVKLDWAITAQVILWTTMGVGLIMVFVVVLMN